MVEAVRGPPPPLSRAAEEEAGDLSLSPVGSLDRQESSELLPAPGVTAMLSELGLSSFAELGQAVALAFHRGEPFRPVSGPALPTSGPPVASAPPVPPAAPAGLSSAAGRSSSAAAIQMSARQWASGPSVSAPDFTNASVEQQCPGVTAAARSFLAGSSSALPQEAVAASILPGGHVQLSAPSFSVPATVSMAALPTFAGVAMSARGEFGMQRSSTPFLVEQFVMGASSISSQLPVNAVFDRGVGVPVSRVTEVKFASDQKLLQFFPSFPNYEAAHHMLLASAVRLGYIFPSELSPSYTIFMRLLQKVLQVLEPLPGGWLAFLKFERECRIVQFSLGLPWDQAVDTFAFTKVLVQLFSPSVNPKLPKISQKTGGVAKPPRGACFAFWSSGSCPKGVNCPFSFEHHCIKCESADHGTGQCGSGQGAA